VTRSTKQDWAKLDRVMGYLRGTPNRSIILRPGSMGIVPRLCVDASYGVHADGKSHTGPSIIIGDTGAVFNRSCRRGIVAKLSTEAELVAASDALNQLLHARELINHQNRDPEDEGEGMMALATSPSYQDNKSSIAMIKAGRTPTELVIANVLTKPLQGEQFRKETAMIAGNEFPRATENEDDHARELLKNQKKHLDNNDNDEPYLMPSPLYHNNKSTIALIKVGRATHEKSRHINIRHFWIHGKVKDKSAVLEYVPTELMIASVLTKPLQGAVQNRNYNDHKTRSIAISKRRQRRERRRIKRNSA
jgi:hypothetical protein